MKRYLKTYLNHISNTNTHNNKETTYNQKKVIKNNNMRTIKFRGLKPDGKGWVYGYFLKPYTECIIVDSESDIKPPPYMVVIPESVGQFTGLKDKNGVEIYEGDMFIINGKVYFVEWGEDLAGFRLTTGKGYDSSNTLDFNCDSIYYSKAIGNIDENEDLLNESTKDIK